MPSVSRVYDRAYSKARLQASLTVYGLPPPFLTQKPSQCKRLATFDFPPFTQKVTTVNISQVSDPSPSPPMKSQPFYSDPLRRIITVSMDVGYTSEARTMLRGPNVNGSREYTIFVHSDALVKLIGRETLQSGALPRSRKEAQQFEWGQWSKYARWTTIPTPPDFGMSYLLCAARYET